MGRWRAAGHDIGLAVNLSVRNLYDPERMAALSKEYAELEPVVKAARAEIRPASPDDLPEMDRQNALFRDGLVEIGYSPVQAVGYCVWQSDDLVAIELVPERVFTQSPGPGAGTEIAR